MRYKSPPRKLKSRCSVCGRCFRKVYWTKAKRKGMSEKRKGGGRPVGSLSGIKEAERVKEIKKRLGYLMDDD